MPKGMRPLAITVLAAGMLYCIYVVVDAVMTGRLYGHRRSVIELASDPELFVLMALTYAVGAAMFARFLMQAIRAPVEPKDEK